MLGISLAHWLVIAGVFCSFTGGWHYIRDTLRGTTKPNRVSWFMWALAPITSGIVAVAAGADIWGTVRVFTAGIFPLIILSVSFYNTQSYWELTFFDLVCGVLSLIALVVWFVTREAQISIVLLLAADLFATIPTVLKAWHHPETETGSSYVLYALASLLAFFAIPIWNIENSAFQIYLLVSNIVLAAPIYRRKLLRSD